MPVLRVVNNHSYLSSSINTLTMFKFSTRYCRLALRILFAFSIVATCGCSRADQNDAAKTPAATIANTPAFTTGLDTYIARDEPAYEWEKVSEKRIGKNMVTTLKMTSQTWQGIEWTHRIEIARPDTVLYPGWAVLYLSTTDGVLESILMQSLAPRIGAVTIHLTGMPNQPLYGKREDALIALTFGQFLQTNDDTWPLLLPMTKGAIKAMDAVQEYCDQEGKPLDKFVVSGASKRGWTTWLVGAADTKNRVAGIVPLVYNNLDLAKQMPHQLASWGEYSPSIKDYTNSGLQAKLNTPRGAELSKIVDPYVYRSRLTMPKLIVNATNDPYWTLDALNVYWNDLSGTKNVYNAPNVGHSMEGDLENVFGSMAAWFKRIARNDGKGSVPSVGIKLVGIDVKGAGLIDVAQNEGVFQANAPHKYELQLDAGSMDALQDAGGVRASRLWVAHSATRDFRKSQWVRVPIEKNSEWLPAGISVPIPATPDGMKYSAAFAEIEYGNDVPSLRLSSPIVIWHTQAAN